MTIMTQTTHEKRFSQKFEIRYDRIVCNQFIYHRLFIIVHIIRVVIHKINKARVKILYFVILLMPL